MSNKSASGGTANKINTALVSQTSRHWKCVRTTTDIAGKSACPLGKPSAARLTARPRVNSSKYRAIVTVAAWLINPWPANLSMKIAIASITQFWVNDIIRQAALMPTHSNIA